MSPFDFRWCHDIGLEQAPNKPLLKTVFQGEVPLLSYSVHKPQAHKMVEMMKSRVYRKHATSGLGAASAAADLLRNGFYVVLGERRKLIRESFMCIERERPGWWSRGESDTNSSISF
ncbi:hypothetical protein AgCh_024509 [Apium graveolens]